MGGRSAPFGARLPPAAASRCGARRRSSRSTTRRRGPGLFLGMCAVVGAPKARRRRRRADPQAQLARPAAAITHFDADIQQRRRAACGVVASSSCSTSKCSTKSACAGAGFRVVAGASIAA
ncbi:hypothetical protein ACU686_07660 [Yinghuangia aomiensis]